MQTKGTNKQIEEALVVRLRNRTNNDLFVRLYKQMNSDNSDRAKHKIFQLSRTDLQIIHCITYYDMIPSIFY